MATADEAMAEARHARLLAEQCAHTCERLEDNFERLEARGREDYANLAAKLDQVGQAVRADVGKVHGRVDQLHLWALGTAITVIISMAGGIAYLLKDGPPWQSPIAGIVSSAQADDSKPAP